MPTLFGSVTNLCLKSCLSLISDLKKAYTHVGLDRLGLLEMSSQLFDPHAEEHQEDTFCCPQPVVKLTVLTVWLIIYHTVYLESLETPSQPDCGLCSGNQFQCTDGKNFTFTQAVFVLIRQRMSNSIFIDHLRTHIYTSTETTLTSWK